MSQSVDDISLITNLNINEYFNDAIHDAISHQRVGLNDETVVYIVNLLTYHSLSENIYDVDDEGFSLKPLAFIYKDAVETQSREARNIYLRRLGDVALFTSGFFSASLERTAVGVDYFISMGGSAYGSLADRTPRTIPDINLRAVFTDLAEHFINYVDVLTEVSESSELHDDRDVLSLYESWLNTGSDYARLRLQEQGVLTFPTNRNKH